MKQSMRWERILIRVWVGTFLTGLIPWIVLTIYLVRKGYGDIDLSLDSEGLPIISQLITLLFFYFLPWVFFSVLITGAAFGTSSLYWYVKIWRRLRLSSKKPVVA